MPFPKGAVEPVLVARNLCTQSSSSDADLKINELEAVTNGTLANTIRQLSSLSIQAEGMFCELTREAHSLSARVNALQIRLDRLSTNTKQLNSDDEEVPLRPIHAKKDFKSVAVFNQHIFSRDTMPTQLLEVYSKCDKPPPLHKLNPYREDGQDSMKFYTDPNFFFGSKILNIPRNVGKLSTHDRRKKRDGPPSVDNGYRRANKTVKQPFNTRERQKQLAIQNGEYIMSQDDLRYRASRVMYTSCGGLTRQYGCCQCTGSTGEIAGQRDTRGAEIGPSHSPLVAGPSRINSHRSHSNRKKLPPPPPPPIENDLHFTEPCLTSSTPAAEPSGTSSTSANIPPAPPLPPDPPVDFVRRPPPIRSVVPSHITHLEPLIPPAGYYDAIQPNGDVIDAVNETTANIRSGIIARKTPETDNLNFHVDLLKAIKDGVELRKVSRDKQKEEYRSNEAILGIDMILSRRVAVEISDSDSSSSKDYDSDSWVEEI